jgi:hypothetical protein
MAATHPSKEYAVPSAGGVRGQVLELSESGEILVAVSATEPFRLWCDYLQTTDFPAVTLQVGCPVLVSLPQNANEKGCVLGRIGPYRQPELPEPADTRKVVVEAQQELELRCGEASVTLNAQGQILIKGTDVVSRAKRNQRIKGGSVQIN